MEHHIFKLFVPFRCCILSVHGRFISR